MKRLVVISTLVFIVVFIPTMVLAQETRAQEDGYKLETGLSDEDEKLIEDYEAAADLEHRLILKGLEGFSVFVFYQFDKMDGMLTSTSVFHELNELFSNTSAIVLFEKLYSPHPALYITIKPAYNRLSDFFDGIYEINFELKETVFLDRNNYYSTYTTTYNFTNYFYFSTDLQDRNEITDNFNAKIRDGMERFYSDFKSVNY